MSIIQRLLQKSAEKTHPMGLTVALLGDSVTQGCFELYKNEANKICTVTEPAEAYAQKLYRLLAAAYPQTPFHTVNVGLSGDRAPNGAKRLARDVLSHRPDLTVVCYGLNDCSTDEGSVEKYVDALERIFTDLKASGSEVIFMTPNTMNRYVSDTFTDPDIIGVAERKMALQNGGAFDAHIRAAKALCQQKCIPVCDCYAIWQEMEREGKDSTALLSNLINHPTREMHALFAEELFKTISKEDL